MHIRRLNYLMAVKEAFSITPVCALLGPRQCGKTTLAKDLQAQFDGPVYFYDLEEDDDLMALENPKLSLGQIQSGLIIIDEIQRRPSLFPYLRVFVDQHRDVKLLILGSASQDLIRQSSETLAGRIFYIEMTVFSMEEINDNPAQLWLRGGYPLSYLAASDRTSLLWRKQYIHTFLEKDVPAMGFDVSTQTMRRFWQMLCDYHGNIFNASQLGNALDINYKTCQRYLDILTGTFMIRTLRPWFENISRRQVKSPKIYFRDSGLLHALVGIEDFHALTKSSKLGNSWEGFAMEQIIQKLKADTHDCYFWGAASGAELDLLVVQPPHKHAFEIKHTSTPKITKSMHQSMEALKLSHLTVIIPGCAHYFLSEQVEVYGLEAYISRENHS